MPESEKNAPLPSNPLVNEVARAITTVLSANEGKVLDSDCIPAIVEAVIDEAQIGIISLARFASSCGLSRTTLARHIEESGTQPIPMTTEENSAAAYGNNVFLSKDLNKIMQAREMRSKAVNFLKGKSKDL